MSDVSQGPGWWPATDGKWYPPEEHPDHVSLRPRPASASTPRTRKTGPLRRSGVPVAGAQRQTASIPRDRSKWGPYAAPATAMDEALDKVRRLGEMLEAGLLSETEFQLMSKEILEAAG